MGVWGKIIPMKSIVFMKLIPNIKNAYVTLRKFTPVLKIFYTGISAISVTLCNSAGHTQIIWVRWRLCPFWWEGGRWSPLFERKNGNRKCRIPNFEKCLTAETGNRTQKWQSWIQNFNFEKYLTAETGNPTQKYNRKCRIPNFEKYLTTETGNPIQKKQS